MIIIPTEVIKLGKIYKKISNSTSQVLHPETETSQLVDFPDQYNNQGKFLATDGTSLYWNTVNAGDSLPSQSENSGKFLTTNGTTLSWATVDALPSQSGNSGKFLTTNGTTASWSTVDALPSQTNNAGKVLITNGSTASWVSLNATQEVFNVTSSTSSVTLTSIPNGATAEALAVYHDGLRLVDTIDYTYNSSTNVITFNRAFLDSDQVVVYIGPIDFGTGDSSGGETIEGLPSQTGNSGKFLTTNGVTTSWGTPTDTITTATTTGSGNAVTSITATNGALTVTKGDSFVDLSTNQTISGVKTFEDNVYTKDVFIVKDDRLQAVRPVSTFDGEAHYAQPFQYRGSDDKILSMLYTPFTRASASNWSNTIQLLAYNVTKENEFARIGVGYNQSGVYTIAPTPATGDNSTQIATTAYVKANLNNYATKASPTFTGTPKAPTAAASTNNTQIATTAFVKTAVANLVNSAPSTLDTLNELAAALNNDANFATTVATQIGEKLDADSSDYVKDLAIAGTTLTVTKGDDTTETLTTYTLPEATTSALGGVIVGSGLSINDGTISANDQLPTQTNNSGKYLTTNGTTVSWGTPTDTTYTQGTGITITGTTISADDQLPAQTGKSGQYLTTDGTNASWGLAVVHPSEKCVLNNNASGTITLDIDDAVIYSLNMTGNSSIVISKDSTLDVYSTNRSATITLLIKNGGSYIITWPSNLNWADSIAPTLSINDKYDVITLITFDSGTTWLGLSTGSNYTLS